MSGDRFPVDLERSLSNPLPAELRLDAPAPGAAEGGGALGLGEQGAHRCGQGGGIGGRHEPAGLVVDDHLADAPHARGDDRGAAGHRLEVDQPEGLVHRRADEERGVAVELHQVLPGQHGVEPAHAGVPRQSSTEPCLKLIGVGAGGAQDEQGVLRQSRGGLEEMKDPLLLADAPHEQHVRRANTVPVQGIAALGAAEGPCVHAVVNNPNALRVDGEMSEHVLAHLRRDGDDPIGALHGRALRPARHRVPRAELLLLPGPEGFEAVERDHERDVEERAHEEPGQRHVPGMRVHDIGVHAVAGHEQVGREGFERLRVAGLARSGRRASGQPVPGRIAAHAQPVFGSLITTKAAYLDPSPAGERAAQVVDDDARAAVDVRRVLAGEHQHSRGDVPITRRRHQRPSRHARG